MATSSDFKDQLKQQADIVRIVGEYVQLRKSGAQNYQGICPFHKEKTPSFSVHATRQFYHCFGCGESGDVFKFIQKIENITFGESIRFIAQKLGIPMPKVEYDSPAEALQAKLRMQLIDINERACAWFQEQLRKPEGTGAREYLAGRGLSPEIISKFRIGFAPESGFLLRDALRGQFDEEVMRESGLFSWKQDDRTQDNTTAPKPSALYSKFRNRVMFPITNEQGRVIAFTGRTLSSDEKAGPKYLNSPETPIYQKSRVLFNLDKAKDAIRQFNYAILVEGQMDCISVYAAGYNNVIASSGTAFTDLQARLLSRFSHRIVVNFDPDTAGATATERTLGLLVEEDFEIKVLTLEPGFDPDLYVRKKGKAAYDAALKSAPRYFDYLISRAQSKFPVRTPEGKVQAVNFLLPHVQRVPSRIARDELANEISQKLNIDHAVLRQELKHAATKRGTKVLAQHANDQTLGWQKIVVVALASADGENGFNAREEARCILQQERLHAGLAIETLVDKLLVWDGSDLSNIGFSDTEKNLFAECLVQEERQPDKQLLDEAFSGLRLRRFELAWRELHRSITDAEKRQDLTTLNELLKQKIQLERSWLAAKHSDRALAESHRRE